ncbi:hypothetical protein C8R41DRAFT_867693 [Lentinula lateritia]|uniref:Uncharacterized protein n=1 Tax=Lentinula lateritia TaxID=40482 RepID=A0ABQ8VGI3_9AGAR|nr:hypothetical protein C8R41DRAFT_867693 [Lentinula lateritia]
MVEAGEGQESEDLSLDLESKVSNRSPLSFPQLMPPGVERLTRKSIKRPATITIGEGDLVVDTVDLFGKRERKCVERTGFHATWYDVEHSHCDQRVIRFGILEDVDEPVLENIDGPGKMRQAPLYASARYAQNATSDRTAEAVINLQGSAETRIVVRHLRDVYEPPSSGSEGAFGFSIPKKQTHSFLAKNNCEALPPEKSLGTQHESQLLAFEIMQDCWVSFAALVKRHNHLACKVYSTRYLTS